MAAMVAAASANANTNVNASKNRSIRRLICGAKDSLVNDILYSYKPTRA